MSTSLDRIRTKAELVPAEVAVRTSATPLGMDVDELLRARRGAAVDLTALRTAAITSGVLGLIVAVAHRWVLGWAAGHAADGGLFVFGWMASVLTFWQVDRWGPIVAALLAAGVVVLAVTTDGFARGRTVEAVGTSVAIGAGAVLSIPLAIVAVLGVLTLVGILVFAAAAVAAAGTILWGLAASAFD